MKDKIEDIDLLRLVTEPEVITEPLRNVSIRSEVTKISEQLIHLYEATDPEKGIASEQEKLARARKALDIYWRLFGKLVLWAQRHLTGYHILESNPELVEAITAELPVKCHRDSHILEFIGAIFSRHPIEDLPIQSQELLRFFPDGATGFDNIAFRKMLMEFLSSSSSGTDWRVDIQDALLALNEGQVTSLVEPAGERPRNRSADLNQLRFEALLHVYYRMGKGIKKHLALSEVAGQLGQSDETLRSWEKRLVVSDERINERECATLAGRLEESLQKYIPLHHPDRKSFGQFRGKWRLDHAWKLLGSLTLERLEALRQELLQIQSKR